MADPLPTHAAHTSSSNSRLPSPCVLPGERSHYPVNIAVDFTQLRVRRSKLKLRSPQLSLRRKTVLQWHEVDSNDVVATFAMV